MDTRKIVARLEIVVEYDEMPDVEELKGTVEELRGYGAINRAKLIIKKDVEVDLE